MMVINSSTELAVRSLTAAGLTAWLRRVPRNAHISFKVEDGRGDRPFEGNLGPRVSAITASWTEQIPDEDEPSGDGKSLNDVLVERERERLQTEATDERLMQHLINHMVAKHGYSRDHLLHNASQQSKRPWDVAKFRIEHGTDHAMRAGDPSHDHHAESDLGTR